MRETNSLISIETIKAIIKKELGINLHHNERPSYIDYYFSKNLNHSVTANIPKNKGWVVTFRKETKSGVDLELVNHSLKTEKDLLDLIKKFKKVRKMI